MHEADVWFLREKYSTDRDKQINIKRKCSSAGPEPLKLQTVFSIEAENSCRKLDVIMVKSDKFIECALDNQPSQKQIGHVRSINIRT